MQSKLTELFWGEQARIFALCIILASLLYFPSLYLPWSLIDDGRFVEYADKAFQILEKRGYGAFFKDVIRVKDNNFGPGLRFPVLVQWMILGRNVWAWHLVKIFSFALFLRAVWELTRQSGGGTLTSCLSLAMVSLFGPQHLYPDFNTYYSNFARLFTTDSYQIIYTLWAVVFLIRGVFYAKSRSYGTWMAFGFSLLCCGLTKITSFPVMASIAVWLLFLFIWARKNPHIRRRVLFYLLGFALFSLPGLLLFRPWACHTITGYSKMQFATTFPSLWKSLSAYVTFCTESLGYLWYFALFLFLSRFIRFLCYRTQAGHPDESFFLSRGLLFLLFISALVFQSFWPIILSRYLIGFSVFLCILTGIEIIELILSWLKKIDGTIDGKTLFLHTILGFGLNMVVLFPYYIPIRPSCYRQIWVFLTSLTCLILCMLGLYLLFFQKRGSKILLLTRYIPVWILAGILSCQLIALCINSVDSAINYYTREGVYSSLVSEGLRLEKELPNNETGIIYTNLEKEQLGSVGLILKHAYGISRVKVKALPPKVIPSLQSRDRIFLIHDYNSAGIEKVPQNSSGHRILSLLNYGNDTSHIRIKPGDKLVVPVSFSLPMKITHVALNADAYSWDTALDFDVFARSGKEGNRLIPLVTFEGLHVTKMRSGPQVMELAQSLILYEDASAIILQCKMSSSPLYSFLSSLPLMKPMPVFIQSAMLEDQPQNPEYYPQVFIFGHPVSPGYTLYKRNEIKVLSLVCVSPPFLLQTYLTKQFWVRARIPCSFRRIRYDYATELFGPPLITLE